jgi:hypothetical protein
MDDMHNVDVLLVVDKLQDECENADKYVLGRTMWRLRP